MMSEDEGNIVRDGEKTEAEKSPTEKIEGEKQTDSLTPGAQSLEDTEVKEERSPNTE